MSCESAEEKQARLDQEERVRVEQELERQRVAEEKRIAEEEKRRKQAIWNEYSENSSEPRSQALVELLWPFERL